MKINNFILLNIFFLVLALRIPVFAQEVILPGLPVIRNYLPREYKAHNQNWAITADDRGVMYFGNSSGVLEFDGYNWNRIEIPNKIVRSLDVDSNGTILVGSIDDFGCLLPDSSGSLQFKSFLSFIDTKESISNVWHTFNIDGRIFFITDRIIFSFYFQDKSYTNPEVKTWKADEQFGIAYRVGKNLYIYELYKGLLKFNGNSFDFVAGSEIFNRSAVFSMLPYDDFGKEILITTNNKGLFIYNGVNFIPFKSEVSNFISKMSIYPPGEKLPDGNFVLNTTNSGIIIFDRQGHVIRVLNMKTGLADDGVLYVAHINNKLWLALENGISSIDIPSDVSSLNQSGGLIGSISDAKVINNVLYAASTAGIFKLSLVNDYSPESKFEKMANLPDEAWWIIEYKNSIISAFTAGIFKFGSSNPIKLNKKWSNCYYVYHSKSFPNRLYVGLENGLAVVDEINGTWIDEGKIEGIVGVVGNIQEDEAGNLWLGTSYDGVYKISKLSTDLKQKIDLEHLSDEYVRSDDEVKIFPSDSGLLFVTERNVLKFDENMQSFYPENSIGFNEKFNKSKVGYILQDSDRNFWISSVNQNSELSLSVALYNAGNYEWKDLSYLKGVIDFSNSNSVFTISKDENTGIVWFCGADGIVSFDSKYLNKIRSDKTSFRALITSVLLKNDSLLFKGDDQLINSLYPDLDFRLSHDNNSLRFEYSALTYNGNLSQYQHKLEGMDNSWSTWSSENRKDFTNLPSGKYIFRVRAKNIYDNISEESTFTFSVLSPWYFSWYAYLVYTLFLIFLIYLIVQFRVKYLINRNIKLESIITDRTKVISEQAEQLKELDDIKSRFFTNISHEFRTPLTITLGQLESVMNSIQDFNLKKKLEMGYQNAKKLLRLINQLLEISKIESGKQKLILVKKNIVSFVRHILFAFESIADQKGISLEINSTHNEIDLYFDFEKMDKVFTNLISNAIKFTNDGGKIKVQISLTKENSLEEKDTVEIIIEDTGIGIPEDRLPFIFDRFYQADRVDKSDIEGTGIGLTLTKELIEIHFGKIEVESKPGFGTKFKIILLLGKDHYKSEEISTEKKENKSERLIPELQIEDSDIEKDLDPTIGSVVKESVLIIDDNSDIRQFIREQLEISYTILEAKDGLVGIETAKEFIPNLIITDVRMPGMDGFELSKKLKEDTLTSHIPIIILTAKSDHSDKLTGLKTGADDYLVKPFSTQELVVRVRNLISIRNKLRDKYSKTANFIPSEVTESSLDQKFLTNVIDDINKYISDEKFNAEILAQNCAISVSQLNRKLNALIGQPAGHFIRSVRMEKAANMIINNKSSIKEAAYFVGYSDQSNFARSFKKHFGKTPGEFISDHAHN